MELETADLTDYKKALYTPTQQDLNMIHHNFTYHISTEGQRIRYTRIRQTLLEAAELLLISCPLSRERAQALGKLEEAMFWANASIAREV